MAFIHPTRERYDPSRDLRTPGQYWVRCIRVDQGQPHWKHQGKLQIVFTFEVVDDRFPKERGKLVSIVTQETVYSPAEGVPSHLVTHARNMGWKNPEQGFDPQEAVGRTYFAHCTLVGERCYVRVAMPQGEMTSGRHNHTPITTRGNVKVEDVPAPPIDGEHCPPW